MEQIIKEIKKFTYQDLLNLEQYDLQYQSLESLFSVLKNKELFLKLITVNALLSYQLTMKWEKYWFCFADYFKNWTTNIKKDFQVFLWKYNKRLLQAKLKRLDKIMLFVDSLDLEKLEHYRNYQTDFLQELAEAMGQKKDAKTIVFCVKMFIWWWRIVWKDTIPDKNIFIPLDNRLLKISKDKKYWLNLSKETWYSLLLLDTLLYISLWWDIEKIEDLWLRKKVEEFREVLGKYVK